MSQRSSRVNLDSSYRKELRQKKRQLKKLAEGRTDDRKTEEMLRLQERISYLENWLSNR